MNRAKAIDVLAKELARAMRDPANASVERMLDALLVSGTLDEYELVPNVTYGIGHLEPLYRRKEGSR